jgi:hypothetical protein
MRQPIQVQMREDGPPIRIEQVSAARTLVDKLDKAGKAYGWIFAVLVALVSLFISIERRAPARKNSYRK